MSLNKRILLVEDDARDIELTLDALSEYHLDSDITVVKDGVEAIDYLYRRNEYKSRPAINPIVILLDIKMPRMNGIQVLKKLKTDEKMHMIPVVIMTSSQDSQDLRECYQLGVNAYVVKPIRFLEFKNTMKQIGVFWAIVNEPPPYIQNKN